MTVLLQTKVRLVEQDVSPQLYRGLRRAQSRARALERQTSATLQSLDIEQKTKIMLKSMISHQERTFAEQKTELQSMVSKQKLQTEGCANPM